MPETTDKPMNIPLPNGPPPTSGASSSARRVVPRGGMQKYGSLAFVLLFFREVIEKKPEEFKKTCLRNIRSVFPEHHYPFAAGFGNKINDVWAYRAVGIPSDRIFSVNWRGELRHEFQANFSSTYTSVAEDLSDHLFPILSFPKRHLPLLHAASDSAIHQPADTQQSYSTFAFWRRPIIDIEANTIGSV